ncbi:hypothetical protein GGR51DRAFT_569924 [Nemania sp. FL0031]|nr:hypothetical protein GGR51DRAFT_569924 [Nemania sp. FL0031]
MEKGDSPSPAPSNPLNQTDDVLHSGFQQLIQHNAATTSYTQPGQQSTEIGSQIGSNPVSRYSSPGPQTNMMGGYGHHTPINHASPYAAPSFTGGYQTAYPLDPSPYPQLPDMGSSATSHNAYSTPATSPPTPVQADGMTTRSGRALMRPSTTTSMARTMRADRQPAARARAKKRKRILGEAYPERSSISLGAPLSELVKDITNIEDTDIQAYVNRSPEERRREVAQSKTGKVKRPMNAFMLYRKAYQNRTKEWKRLDDIRRKEESASEGKPEKGHDNHQVISQVCGMSWNMEPQELRDQYDEWAKIERNNHKLAFPDYKFAPAKSKIKKLTGGAGGGSGGSGQGDRESEEDNASNLDVYDFNEWPPSSSGPPSRATMRYPEGESEYALPPGYPHSAYTSPSPGMQAARLPPGYHQPMQQTHHFNHPHPSSFQYSNPGKPRPSDYGTLGQGQYYQQSTEFTQTYPPHYGAGAYGIHHPGIPAMVENVYINKTNSPASSFHGSPVLDHRVYNELMGPAATYAPQIAHPHTAIPHPQIQHFARHPGEHQIDPSLMATHQGPVGMGSHAGHDTTYDTLGIFGLGQGHDFVGDSLSGHHLDQNVGGLGGSHIGSPHPQQFEQAYHTPNDATTTPGAEGGGNDTASGAGESSWQDLDTGASATDTKMPSSDWETALGGAADFQLEDIDQILGTTDSPGG